MFESVVRLSEICVLEINIIIWFRNKGEYIILKILKIMDSLFEIDFYFNFIANRYYIIRYYVIQKDQISTLLLYFYFY